MTEEETQIEMQVIELKIEDLPKVDRESARLSYNFLMPALVRRLYLYLFGEVDREHIKETADKVLETRKVIDQIINEKIAPLRAIYDYLIKIEWLEDQRLTLVAMAYINQLDTLQQRIVEDGENPTPFTPTGNDTMRKIILNCVLPITASPYTHLYDLNKSMGD